MGLVDRTGKTASTSTFFCNGSPIASHATLTGSHDQATDRDGDTRES